MEGQFKKKAYEVLIELISKVIGKEVTQASAQSALENAGKSIEYMSDLMRKNSDLSISYEYGGLRMDNNRPVLHQKNELNKINDNALEHVKSEIIEDIAHRAVVRLRNSEIYKQQNIEKIINKTGTLLGDEIVSSNENIDESWVRTFFEYGSKIGDDTLQNIWAQILSGEIKRPKSYSLRALETLKLMTKDDIEVLQRMSSFVLQSGKEKFIYNNKSLLDKYGMNIDSILMLQECGFLTQSDLRIKIIASRENADSISNFSKVGVISVEGDSSVEFKVPAYIITSTGRELLNVINIEENYDYFIDCIKELKKEQPAFKFSVYSILERNDDGILYNPKLNLFETS